MSTKSDPTTTFKELTPKGASLALRAMMLTSTALFLWGPPGISKSASAMQVATDEGIAFIDIRLSQMEPTDLRGIPYPFELFGEKGVKWSVPTQLPRDLDMRTTVEVPDGDVFTVSIAHLNPQGSNGIHYVTNVKYAVTSLTKGAEARLISEGLDFAEIGLFDAEGNLVAGKVRVSASGKARAILALEEFNSAPPSVQAAAYQFVLDKRLGEYIVPAGVYICAMGNHDTDKGVTFKMGKPIANRFAHIHVIHSHSDWEEWALTRRINADVVGYLGAFKSELFQFNPESDERAFRTPRSWTYVAELLDKAPLTPDHILRALIAGCIGDGGASQFIEYRKRAGDLPKPEPILRGDLKKMPKQVDIALSYMLTTTLCYELKERSDAIKRSYPDGSWKKSPEREQWLREADNALEFMMQNFQKEVCVMAARSAISTHRLPFDTNKMKHFDSFAEMFQHLIIA